MHLCDVNFWLALVLSGHKHHMQAQTWMDGIEEPGAVAFCRVTQQGFLRLVTTEAVWKSVNQPALTNEAALDVYDDILKDGRVFYAAEPPGLEAKWREFAGIGAAAPKIWTDAYLAGFAMCASLKMVTFDEGFRRYSGLDLVLLGP